MTDQSKFKAKIKIVVIKNNRIKIQIVKNKEIKDFKNIKDIKKQSKSMNVFHVSQTSSFKVAQISAVKVFFKASKNANMHEAFFIKSNFAVEEYSLRSS